MKALSVYPGLIGVEQPLGLLYISAALKQISGVEVKWFDHNASRNLNENPEINFVKRVEEFKPDIINFSVSSPCYFRALTLASCAKKINNKIIIVFGGQHPTIAPEEVLSNKDVDFICRGEGDEAIKDLVNSLKDGKDCSNILNLGGKTNGKIYINSVRRLCEDLDVLPVPDRKIIADLFLGSAKIDCMNFITSRGCPHQCSYCINPFLQELYKGKGRFVRKRKIKDVIDEIKNSCKEFEIKKIIFSDETFTYNKKYLLEFLSIYKAEIGLPFLCQTRADRLDIEVCRALKDSGCILVSLGIESGNDKIRNEILNRDLKKEDIVNAFKSAHKAGLQVGAFNMIGLPGESEKEIIETINFNRKLKADHPICQLFMPLKGTPIRTLCEEKKIIIEEVNENYATQTFMNTPDISKNILEAYLKAFSNLVVSHGLNLILVKLLFFIIARFRKGSFAYKAANWVLFKLDKRLMRKTINM